MAWEYSCHDRHADARLESSIAENTGMCLVRISCVAMVVAVVVVMLTGTREGLLDLRDVRQVISQFCYGGRAGVPGGRA